MSTINTTPQPETASPFKRRVWANSTRILKTAGMLALLAAAQWVLLVIVAETQYPNYVIQQHFLSDLGATCQRGLVPIACVIVFPSSLIWDSTLALMGLLSLVSAVLVYAATRKKGFSLLFGLGVGGIERMVVYPIVIWEIALGAFLMSGALSPSHGEKE